MTPQVQRAIVEALEAGNWFDVACRFAGIPPSVGYEWLARGRGTHPRSSTPLYRQFAEAVEQAVARAEVHAVAKLRSHFGANPRAALEFLERRFPERWAKTENALPAPENASRNVALVLEEVARAIRTASLPARTEVEP